MRTRNIMIQLLQLLLFTAMFKLSIGIVKAKIRSLLKPVAKPLKVHGKRCPDLLATFPNNTNNPDRNSLIIQNIDSEYITIG